MAESKKKQQNWTEPNHLNIFVIHQHRICNTVSVLSTRDQHTKIPIYINLLHDFYAGTIVCASNMELLRIKLHTQTHTHIYINCK